MLSDIPLKKCVASFLCNLQSLLVEDEEEKEKEERHVEIHLLPDVENAISGHNSCFNHSHGNKLISVKEILARNCGFGPN